MEPGEIPTRTVQTASDGTAAAAWVPDVIGRYRILRLVGEGGMGVVYEAEQDQPRRAVALKIMRPGTATPETLRRFAQESHALGRLQHPGIAQVYEAGTAESPFGPQPYFAMEFIHGETLNRYVDARQLQVRQRLDLMARICDAVHHAHQRGLIHRDLKPANILIDETGQPKVLDFGVARLTDSDVKRTQHTDLGQLVGTLSYMSPEQVLADPLELDTRSDVYALGVILYELLAGRLPYTISTRVHEAAKTIQEDEPKRLSSVSRVYRGDLETIAAKALEKDKTRRYGSAAALAADIRRYLNNEPITARPASASYQLQKFARRHRALVTGVAAVFVALTIGIVATTREAIRARRAERHAVTAENTAQAVNEFLQNDLLAQAGAFMQAAPGVKPDPDLKVRTALDRAAARIEGKFRDQPLVEAAIRRTIGRTYRDLGLYKEAKQHLERSLQLRQTAAAHDSLETFDVLDDLAQVHVLQGEYAAAEPMVKMSVDERRRIAGEEHPGTLSAVDSLGLVYSRQDKTSLAEPLLTKSLAIRRRTMGEEHPGTLNTMNILANVYGRLEKMTEAEQLLAGALAISRRVKGEEHPETVNLMNDLSGLYRAQGKYAEGVKLQDSAVAILRRTMGEEHHFTLTATASLALIHSEAGNVAAAEAGFRRVAESQRRVLGDDHPDTLFTLNNISGVLRLQGKYAEAQAILAQVLDARVRVSGSEHAETLRVMSNMGVLYSLQGRHEDALAIYQKSFAVSNRISGPEHPDTLRDLERIALARRALGRFGEAEPDLSKVVEGRRRILGPAHPLTLRVTMFLGRVQLQQQKFAAAERTLRAALDGYSKTTPDAWSRYVCQSVLGASVAGQKKHAEAEPLLIGAYEGLIRLFASLPPSERQYIELAATTLSQLYAATHKAKLSAEWKLKSQQTSPAAPR
jgi:tetratricopeptide (TPR) repeat protein